MSTGLAGPLTPLEASYAASMMGVHLGYVQQHYETVRTNGELGLIIGEAPGTSTSAELPMFPHPATSAGGRLLTMSGLHPAAYLGRLWRMNLCQLGWNMTEAREAAAGALRGRARSRVLLCGRRVARAFDIGDAEWFAEQTVDTVSVRVIPHPSGRSPMYNSPANVQAARDAVRWAARIKG